MMKRSPQNQPLGESHHAAVLTESTVRAMRDLRERKALCISCIAKLYGVRRQTAYDAITYCTWRHVR